ncbi:alcohol dehydrogenase catalytic domain-containing protein [Dictyobacter aurantiacus]|uniref:NAD(P)-dependent alcohol dehydrogenase n=1 Tax=Dictyobacter aurantiacus TaxID=1936993 RepID=A0A401ZQ71_9CHLR|nr:zinc-binding dehydrogenase [Dictyobacter aurantiacus]GCE08924.1 NAD(P)-dependent alcohol dehydrogenase [Dictyobacter aurantiacus]
MKAVRLVEARYPLQMQEIPVPSIGERDVLIRVRAAGICHSDVHYRTGQSPVQPLPRTLGHEIAGVVEQVGSHVTTVEVGSRVCVHYVLSCGECSYCNAGHEQFCTRGSMVGRFVDGGYAEYVAVPEHNTVHLPDEIPFEQGAILMCSSATAFHALRKSRLRGGETVAIFGIGGLGASAIQLAYAFGALDVYAIDINADKCKIAEQYGAIPVNASVSDPVTEIRRRTQGKGVDVALEVIGLPQTMKQAIQSLAVMGRAVVAGISHRPLEVDTYQELIGREGEVIGASDHLLHELPLLLELARRGKLKISDTVTRTIPLDAGAINQVLDNLEQFRSDVRTVIVP